MSDRGRDPEATDAPPVPAPGEAAGKTDAGDAVRGPIPAANAPAARGARASLPIVASVAVLVVAAAIALASVVSRGSLAIGGTSDPDPSAPMVPTAVVSSAGASPSSAGATAAPSPTPTATPSPTPTASPSPTPAPSPMPTPRVYPDLAACPDDPDCYVYVVRRGDTLTRIAVRYGVGIAEILERNPSITDPGFIYIGEEIRLPTPRR